MDGIQMEPIGKYKADRNGSAKAAAWRNMVDADLDDVAFLADSDKAREARESRSAPVAVCSQRRALCLAVLVFSTLFSIALLVVYAAPAPDLETDSRKDMRRKSGHDSSERDENECPCMPDSALLPGQPPTDAEAAAAANKDRIASNGLVFPWRGARLPPFVIPRHYSLWLHPNLTTGELRGEVSIDFRVDRDTMFVVLNVRDMNVTERALFKTGGAQGPKIAKTLDYPPADQTYIEFKDKLRRKFNYTLSLRFITKLERSEKQRGFYLAGNHRHRCAVSRFWLTHARSAFPCFDEPHFRATFKLTIVRDRFHVSLTNMPIVATEEAGFYLGHRLLQDEFADTPPMSPHMMAMAVCRLQRRAAPPLPTPPPPLPPSNPPSTETSPSAEEDDLPPPEISLYSDQQDILDEAGPLLDWVQKTIQQFAYELNTSYPLPKLDIVVLEGGSPYSEGWGLIMLSPTTLSDTKIIARLLAQQWFSGLVSPRWWNAQWLMSALTSVLMERAPAALQDDNSKDDLLLSHVLPALRLDSSSSVRAVASPRLEIADIESATDDLSIHKGAAIVSMSLEAAGAAGRAALARLLAEHRAASADARDLWRALQRHNATGTATGGANPAVSPGGHAWDTWCERPGYPLLTARRKGRDVVLRQERFLMTADPPDPEPPLLNDLLTLDLRADLEDLFYEPENLTEIIDDDVNSTTTTTPPPTTTRKPVVKPTKAPPPPKWYIPLTFVVGPLEQEYEDEQENITKVYKNTTESILHNGTWYDVGNDTKAGHGSRWAENVTHLVWMNDTEMTIRDLGKHKWVRYNVGARGLYRVAPQDPLDGEQSAEAVRSQYGASTGAERAMALDDAFVLSRAARLSAARALAAAVDAVSNGESHWAPWHVVISHLSSWRALLQLSAAGPCLAALLQRLAVSPSRLYNATAPSSHRVWLSGALLTAGVEWEQEAAVKSAEKLFDDWHLRNQTIHEVYQEAAFTAGVRRPGAAGAVAWLACWRALRLELAAPRPRLSLAALRAALAAPHADYLFYKFAWTVLSKEAQRNTEWREWVVSLYTGACKWRGAAALWRVLRTRPPPPPSALLAAARCLRQPQDYYQFKELFGKLPGADAALDMIALNVAWVQRAEADLLNYFNSTCVHETG